jgi:NTE family protein
VNIIEKDCRKKIGLAFGGGGAKSFAHIGVVNVLKENGIPIDFIATCSAGSLMGALIGHEVEMDRIRKKFGEIIKRITWLRPTISKKAIMSQRNFNHIIEELIGDVDIESSKIPMKIVTTNLNTGELAVFSKGSLKLAVAASSAFPGIYKPVKIGEDYFVDGGLLDSIPADICRAELGEDAIVISITLDGHLSREIEKINIFSLMYRTIYIPVIHNRIKTTRENSDVIIHAFGHQEFTFRNWREIYKFYSMNKMEEFIRVGEEAAYSHLDEIKALMTNKSVC